MDTFEYGYHCTLSLYTLGPNERYGIADDMEFNRFVKFLEQKKDLTEKEVSKF